MGRPVKMRGRVVNKHLVNMSGVGLNRKGLELDGVGGGNVGFFW